MAISQPVPDANIYQVDIPLDVYDDVDALLLDHLLDHLHLLLLVATVGTVPDDHTRTCLQAHPRYQPFLTGSRKADAQLVQLLHVETGILLAALVRLLRTPYKDKPGFYRRLRQLVPYLAHADYPARDE